MTDVVEDLTDGRRGVGTVNHCVHGKNVSIEEVLDWVPPEYETKRIKTPYKGVPRIVITMELIARGPDQTDLVYRVARPRSIKDRLILQAMEGQFRTDRGARQRNAHRARRGRCRGARRWPRRGAGRPGEHRPPPVGAAHALPEDPSPTCPTTRRRGSQPPISSTRPAAPPPPAAGHTPGVGAVFPEDTGS